MHKAFKWLAPIITVGVAIFIIIFLIKMNPSNSTQVEQLKIKNTEVKGQESDGLWLNHFSKSEEDGYYYPVNEIFIDMELVKQIELPKKNVLEQSYQLNASISDPYQFFCLQEELKKYKVRYFLKKDHLDTKLLIYSQEKSILDALVRALKTYDINANILPYKEEKQWKKVQ